MCGISGFFGYKKISNKAIDRTLQLMKNRGPDFSKFSNYQLSEKLNLYFLHSRLSIIDLNQRSNQPLQIENYIIIYNGEIYNARELSQNLEKKNIKLKTHSDTEVLLHYYKLYGEKCVDHFEGMWSFAIINLKTKKLFLSRDRFGEKPLYYYKQKDGIYFGSETKFIRSLSEEKFEINKKRINSFLSFGYKCLSKNDESYYKNIVHLPKSHNLIINENLNLDFNIYWEPTLEKNDKLTSSDAIEKIKLLLFKSIDLRMRSDVPLAFCLSGGVDSGSLASIATKKFNKNISTFSIIDKDERYNEKDNIDLVINELKCNHEYIEIDKKNFIEELKELIIYHDSPVLTLAQYLHYKMMKSIKSKNFKVAISGTAADEIFTGYYDHFLLHLNHIKDDNDFETNLDSWKKKILPLVRNKILKNPNLYIDDKKFRDHIYDGYKENTQYLLNPEKFKFYEKDFKLDLFSSRRLNELFYEITPPILHNEDLNAMKNSIENRSPFLDKDLFNFCFSIPPKLLIQNGYGKFLLREAMKGILNDQVRLDVQKKGFNCSINTLINLSDPSTIKYLTEDSEIFEFVDRENFKNLLNDKYKENYLSKFLFTFISCKQFLDKHEKY